MGTFITTATSCLRGQKHKKRMHSPPFLSCQFLLHDFDHFLVLSKTVLMLALTVVDSPSLHFQKHVNPASILILISTDSVHMFLFSRGFDSIFRLWSLFQYLLQFY